MEDFSTFVKNQWGVLISETPAHLGLMRSLLHKLNKLQLWVRIWEKDRKAKEDLLLCDTELEIHIFGGSGGQGLLCH